MKKGAGCNKFLMVSYKLEHWKSGELSFSLFFFFAPSSASHFSCWLRHASFIREGYISMSFSAPAVSSRERARGAAAKERERKRRGGGVNKKEREGGRSRNKEKRGVPTVGIGERQREKSHAMEIGTKRNSEGKGRLLLINDCN